MSRMAVEERMSGMVEMAENLISSFSSLYIM